MPPDRRATQKVRNAIRNSFKKPKSDKLISKPKPKPRQLPLVERTNALSLEEFKSAYVPSSELSFQRPDKRTSATAHEQTGTKPQTQFHENEDHAASRDKSNSTSYDLTIYTASTIPPAEFESCFKLIEQTSSTAYKDSSMSWSPTEKRKEMKLPDMKYMILRQKDPPTESVPDEGQDANDNQSGELAGFLSFMVTYEDGYEVLYLYEIHLTPEVQGQGLGEILMGRFESIGRRIGLEKTMLTVFKSNSRAVKFYTRVGYMEDEYSPQPRRLRNGTVKEADYLILSKTLR